jgi:peptidyl-prolyl cis-trans isomerase D
MSVIQKIRSKYAKIAGFVIALSLVGFILMDATSSGRFRDLFGRDESVVKVNGEKIDQREYSQKVKDFEILYEYSYAQQGRTVDEATKSQISQQALSDLINFKLVSKECDKLGLTTTKDEEKEMIYGASPDPIVRQYQYFQNPDTKMFDPQRVKAFEQQVMQIDPSGKLKEQWETLKSFVVNNNKLRKYNAMLSKNGILPTFIFDKKNKEKNEMASIRFLRVPYSSVDDKQVPVTEADMIEYMNAHKKQYTQDQESRSIEFVSFDIIPSAADTTRALGTLTQLKPELANTIDVESIVNRNSDDQYNPSFVNKKSFASLYADSIFGLPVGTVYGPYFDNGSYKLTKVIDKKMLPDSVKCRHILVRTENQKQAIRNDSAANKMMDSAVALTKAGTFAEAVQKYSEDDGSKATGGEYTFTLQQKSQLSKEFADFIFDGKPGEKKTVKVSNDAYAGYHYIEILEHNGVQTAAKLATISKALEAGEQTTNDLYAKAAEFAGKNNTGKAFDAAVKKDGTNKKVAENIKENDFNIQGIGNSREIVRWMYEVNEGDVSAVFAVQGRYVIAKVSSVQKPGLMKLDANNRPNIEMLVKNDKKAKIIRDKFKSITSFDQLATTSGQTVGQADSFSAASQFVNRLGYEPMVVGYAFSKDFKPNTLSPGFKAMEGVMYISLINRFTSPSVQTPEQLKQEKVMMSSQSKGVLSGAFGSLMKNAKIKYNVQNL